MKHRQCVWALVLASITGIGWMHGVYAASGPLYQEETLTIIRTTDRSKVAPPAYRVPVQPVASQVVQQPVPVKPVQVTQVPVKQTQVTPVKASTSPNNLNTDHEIPVHKDTGAVAAIVPNRIVVRKESGALVPVAATKVTVVKDTAVKAPVGTVPATKPVIPTVRDAITAASPLVKEHFDLQQKEDGAPLIRVRLGVRSQPFSVVSATPVHVLSTTGDVLQTIAAGTTLSIVPTTQGVEVQGNMYTKPVVLRSGDKRDTGLLGLFGKKYRGDVYVLPAAGRAVATVVNHVSLEQYLYGVVPEEAVPSWPLEALKAQAVAARTYALYNHHVNEGRSYDVEVDTNSQVYGGESSEYSWTNKAVDETKGLVMTYQGKPIDAMFHADGGGYTENSENVWGTPLPYLRGVKDYSNNGSTTHWTVTTSRSKIESLLAAAGKGVGTLERIQISPLTAPPMHVADRGVSGRVKQITFVGSQRSVTLSGDQLMQIFNLKSTLVDFQVQHPLTITRDEPEAPAVQQTAKRVVTTKRVMTRKLMTAGRVPGMTQSEQIPVTRSEAPRHEPTLDGHTFGRGDETVIIRGYGWGHGLGMSQWGAAEMAAKAPKGDTSYYEYILKHYYQGITLTPWYKK